MTWNRKKIKNWHDKQYNVTVYTHNHHLSYEQWEHSNEKKTSMSHKNIVMNSKNEW